MAILYNLQKTPKNVFVSYPSSTFCSFPLLQLVDASLFHSRFTTATPTSSGAEPLARRGPRREEIPQESVLAGTPLANPSCVPANGMSRVVTPPHRRARLHHLPLLVATRTVPFLSKTFSLAVLQAVVGTPRRWHLLQVLIAAAAAGVPGLGVLRTFAVPLACSWAYGVATRVFVPAHARSLKFWKKVVPIYLGYKVTQAQLAVQRASPQKRAKKWNRRHEWGAEKVYNLCVEMRGFYLKDGQFLGARSDLIPAAWCDSLRRLQDRVPPVEFSQIEKTVREAYRINRVSQIFGRIETIPLASATIAQVHRGEMPDGTEIVLKTQYRDQERLCEMDLLNLKRLAKFLQKHDMSFFDMDSVVREFEKQIPTEFDFVREAEMMTRIGINLKRAGLNDVVVPTVLPGLVSKRALTMTFIDGCRFDNQLAMQLWGIDGREVMKTIGRAYGQMLLVDGVAHCDPHLGNLICLRDRRVGLIDFGQAKTVPDELRRRLCAFYLALCSKHDLYILQALNDLGIELDVVGEDMDDAFVKMVPMYANGMLDTAPLPAGVEMNPFSEKSPLQQVGIKRFNADLLMVLRTIGLLRSLSEMLQVDGEACWMSRVFRPFAEAGLRRRVDAARARAWRRDQVRDWLTSGVSSPFTAAEAPAETCAIC